MLVFRASRIGDTCIVGLNIDIVPKTRLADFARFGVADAHKQTHFSIDVRSAVGDDNADDVVGFYSWQ